MSPCRKTDIHHRPLILFSLLIIALTMAFMGCSQAPKPYDETHAEQQSDGGLLQEDSGPPATAPNGPCERYGKRLRECDVISNGTYNCQLTSDPLGVCTFDCLSQGTCDELKAYYCDETAAEETETCVANCLSADSSVFVCPKGPMIPTSWVCDGVDDCRRGDDEDECTVINCATSDDSDDDTDADTDAETDAETYLTGQQCNGVSDCTDGSDEQDCSFFSCETGDQTILLKKQCDQTVDCEDASDEAGCDGYFLCTKSHEIIQLGWRCDGQPDCADQSDENGCDYFTCNSGDPVHKGAECDLFTDCNDGSDEWGCAQRNCGV